jgi:ABC-type polysaccharide/polyol phosphate transport system ATPase subunit
MIMDDFSIKLENVSKYFRINDSLPKNKSKNMLIALDNVSISVKKGKILGIIGRNGSGKTTLLRIIAEIYSPDSGSVNVQGKIAPLLQLGTGFHNELNAVENIMMNGILLGLDKKTIKQKTSEIISFADLEKFAEMKLKHYSAGMRVRLAFSIALQVDPDILMIDEVISVGDIEFRKKSFDAFLSFREKGKTIIFTTHNLKMASDIADELLLLDKGKVLSIGNPSDVIEQYQKLSLDHQ